VKVVRGRSDHTNAMFVLMPYFGFAILDSTIVYLRVLISNTELGVYEGIGTLIKRIQVPLIFADFLKNPLKSALEHQRNQRSNTQNLILRTALTLNVEL
jgi:hypothetical protein